MKKLLFAGVVISAAICTSALAAPQVIIIKNPSDLQQLQTVWQSAGYNDPVYIVDEVPNNYNGFYLELDVSVSKKNPVTGQEYHSADILCPNGNDYQMNPGSALVCMMYYQQIAVFRAMDNKPRSITGGKYSTQLINPN